MNDAANRPRLAPQALKALLENAGASARNLLAERLPGERPAWVVLEFSGTYPARRQRRKLLEFPPDVAPRDPSLEGLQERLEALSLAPWLKGVVLRCEGLRVNLATAYALRQQLEVLKRAGKGVVAYLSQLDTSSYYFACAADEIVAPESAELSVTGLAVQLTFMRDALSRYGVVFDKLAIEAYKNAADEFVRQEMSAAQREQYEVLLSSFEATLLETVARDRRVTPEAVRGWVDEGVTSAARALELGMLDRVAYEDELLGPRHRPYQAAARFLPARRRPLQTKRVAVISLLGVIVPGKSRRSPLPLPLVGGLQAGSETLLRAFRSAEADESTAAILFYVDSGGGSALASDLIWREVARVGAKKPVVAVMGALAASGGYYVLTHAARVIAAPTTLTGSIGVLAGKFVLEGFNAKYGFNPEALQRGRFSLAFSSAHPFDAAERELVRRSIAEVYARFTRRVADGRKLSQQRVDELGRGRIWSGRDALDRGLVDELGDVALGLRRARELAGLPDDAPAWNVPAPSKLLLPSSDDPTTLLRTLAPLQREKALLLHAEAVSFS